MPLIVHIRECKMQIKVLIVVILTLLLTGCPEVKDNCHPASLGVSAGKTYEYEVSLGGAPVVLKSMSVSKIGQFSTSLNINDGEDEIILEGRCLTDLNRDMTWDEALLVLGDEPLPTNQDEEMSCIVSGHQTVKGELTGDLCESTSVLDDDSILEVTTFKTDLDGEDQLLSYEAINNGALVYSLRILDIN